jgi:hypothetical protein
MPSKRVVTFWLDTGAPISLLPCEHHCGCLPRLSHPGSSGAARRAQPQVSCARGGGCSPLIPAYASSGRRDPPRGEDAAPNHATPERHPPDLAVVAPGDRQAAIQELQAALDAGVEHALPTAIDRARARQPSARGWSRDTPTASPAASARSNARCHGAVTSRHCVVTGSHQGLRRRQTRCRPITPAGPGNVPVPRCPAAQPVGLAWPGSSRRPDVSRLPAEDQPIDTSGIGILCCLEGLVGSRTPG